MFASNRKATSVNAQVRDEPRIRDQVGKLAAPVRVDDLFGLRGEGSFGTGSERMARLQHCPVDGHQNLKGGRK